MSPRKRFLIVVLLLAACLLFGLQISSAAGSRRGEVMVATIASPITPVTADYLASAIKIAEEERAELLVLELDTPGGLDTSMRHMVQSMLKSRVPVAVYVSPQGARAASAGVLITMAADVAAMAPGTNIGAAHPVNVGGGKMDNTMSQKMENDAAAYARSLAGEYGRNVEWAESAVRESAALSAKDALDKKVIDLIAKDLNDLLAQIDGREIRKGASTVVLRTKDAPVKRVSMTLRHRVLSAVSDPTIAYLLLMVGIYGIYFELSSPGAFFPGVLGGICLLLGLYALHTLSAGYAGILLILLALVLFFAEMKVQSHGLLLIGGLVSMFIGSLMLFDRNIDPYLRISWPVLIGTVAFSALFFGSIVSLAVRSQFIKPRTGAEGLTGEIGEAATDFNGEGKVFIVGEFWNARADAGSLRKGDKVIVKSVNGMTLLVEPYSRDKA